jgi:hypothetical protein
MRYTTLKYAIDGRIARVTLNRPERLNAINEKSGARSRPRTPMSGSTSSCSRARAAHSAPATT